VDHTARAAPRVAVGSFLEEFKNSVEGPQQAGGALEPVCVLDHPYPAIKIG
jgi:hypothetical protein